MAFVMESDPRSRPAGLAAVHFYVDSQHGVGPARLLATSSTHIWTLASRATMSYYDVASTNMSQPTIHTSSRVELQIGRV